MYTKKKYNLIVLANHKPSKWAKETVLEYFGGKTFIDFQLWRVTTGYSLKEFKKKFKFNDLPCLVVEEYISGNRKRKEHFYGDEIEKTCREVTKEGIRESARATQRENSARLRLRAKRGFDGDVIPARKRKRDRD